MEGRTGGYKGHGDLPVTFSPGSIVSVAPYFGPDEQLHHAIVGTTAGKVHEIWWKAGQAGIEGHGDLPVTFSPGSIVSALPDFGPDEQLHHAIVGYLPLGRYMRSGGRPDRRV